MDVVAHVRGRARTMGEWMHRLRFRQALWAFPFAFSLHVLEEAPQFTAWANRFISPQFTYCQFVTINTEGIATAFLAPVLFWFFPNSGLAFLPFATVLAPCLFWNIFFHAGTTSAFGVYSPGLITALTIYPPLFYLLSRLVLQERLLTRRTAVAALIIAGIFHATEVAYHAFFIRFSL